MAEPNVSRFTTTPDQVARLLTSQLQEGIELAFRKEIKLMLEPLVNEMAKNLAAAVKGRIEHVTNLGVDDIRMTLILNDEQIKFD